MAAEDPTKQQFDILRKRARQAAQKAGQAEQEGLQRRFASIGQVGSGAQIRAEAQASERGAKRLEQAEETVGLAELAEKQRRQEIQEGRAFARGEREASQGFAAEQAGIGRAFAGKQAGLGRQFSAEQAELARKFATGERVDSQEFAGLQAEMERKSREDLAKMGIEATAENLDRQISANMKNAANQRAFATSERVDAQEFASDQAVAAREGQTKEREAAQIFASGEAELDRRLKEVALSRQKEAINEQIRQFELEFDRDSGTIAFNKKMAISNASKTLWDDLGIGDVDVSGEDIARGVSLASTLL